MSNIYIQEPPALGKVLLKTTVGEIDIELWTKEAPKACRNFIQLCMEGYYNGTIFHRVVPDFIVQGGDPNGDGTGGESIYGNTFKDEFHTRLRFNRRGLVAMANSGKDDNGSQFFFTLNSTPELQNKHTIFAKVTGETIYNVLKLAEGDIDEDERPAYPHKIISSEILVNPFDDIVPRIVEKPIEVVEKKKKEKGVKNFGLLSFGMEAEEDEDQSIEYRGKPKSTHDLLDDPKLSKLTATDIESGEIENLDADAVAGLGPDAIANIRDKLQSKNKNTTSKSEVDDQSEIKKDDEEEIEEYYLGKDKKEARQKQVLVIREQIKELKKEMSAKKDVDVVVEKEVEKPEPKVTNDMMQQYESEQEKYKKKMDELPKKGVTRMEQSSMQQNSIPWVKKLYEHTGYPDNHTDQRFLQQLKKNIHVYDVTFLQCFLGSCRVTQKVSTCVLFSIIFTYLYNEWVTAQFVFSILSVVTLLGYSLFLFISIYVPVTKEKIDVNSDDDEFSNVSTNFSDEEKFIDNLLKINVDKHTKKSSFKKHTYGKIDRTKPVSKKSKSWFMKLVFDDLKMVLIYLVFGYIFSPILHSLTDTVSTDTIFATTIFMMLIHLIFSDYGLSVAVVSNSLSVNSAIFGSICLASRLSNPFCAFVLLTLSVLAFVLSPMLIKMIWNTNYAIFVFCATALVTFVSLWIVSRTIFCFFLITVIFLNLYCPYLFVKWQKYKDNIYGPWDEAVVHDSDDISDCIGIQS